jgi:hypothetical protein
MLIVLWLEVGVMLVLGVVKVVVVEVLLLWLVLEMLFMGQLLIK